MYGTIEKVTKNIFTHLWVFGCIENLVNLETFSLWL